jgi:hypothetical protein
VVGAAAAGAAVGCTAAACVGCGAAAGAGASSAELQATVIKATIEINNMVTKDTVPFAVLFN